jgi:hypothetical protein
MPFRVVQVATGNAGRITLSQLISDPRFELAGLVVSNPAKVGRDAGELAGLGAVTGVPRPATWPRPSRLPRIARCTARWGRRGSSRRSMTSS